MADWTVEDLLAEFKDYDTDKDRKRKVVVYTPDDDKDHGFAIDDGYETIRLEID